MWLWQIKGCILGNLFIPNVKVSRSLLQRKLTLCIHVSLQLVFVPRLKMLKMGWLAEESIVYEKGYESLFFHSFVKTDPLTLWSILQARSSCILSKQVARDRALKEWTFLEGSDISGPWGSGYPGDPVTKKFLQEQIHPIFGFPGIVRFSWKTAEKILDEKCIRDRVLNGIYQKRKFGLFLWLLSLIDDWHWNEILVGMCQSHKWSMTISPVVLDTCWQSHLIEVFWQ